MDLSNIPTDSLERLQMEIVAELQSREIDYAREVIAKTHTYIKY